jgi:protein-disulfide isomerase
MGIEVPLFGSPVYPVLENLPWQMPWKKYCTSAVAALLCWMAIMSDMASVATLALLFKIFLKIFAAWAPAENTQDAVEYLIKLKRSVSFAI